MAKQVLQCLVFQGCFGWGCDLSKFLLLIFQLPTQTEHNNLVAVSTSPDLSTNPEDEEFPECDWSEHYCPDGNKYYYNCVTCESRVMFETFDLIHTNFFGFLLLCCNAYCWRSGKSQKNMTRNHRSNTSKMITAFLTRSCRYLPLKKFLRGNRSILIRNIIKAIYTCLSSLDLNITIMQYLIAYK